MTKQEALAKIAELQKFVGELEEFGPLKFTNFKTGDVFDRLTYGKIVILQMGLNSGEPKYYFGGYQNAPLAPFSDGCANGGMTKEKVLNHLNSYDYVFRYNINQFPDNIKEKEPISILESIKEAAALPDNVELVSLVYFDKRVGREAVRFVNKYTRV
jgi:hypothetical protein